MSPLFLPVLNTARLCWANEKRFAEGEMFLSGNPEWTRHGFLLEFTPYLIRGRNDDTEIDFEFYCRVRPY
jgi:hypothetical protein